MNTSYKNRSALRPSGGYSIMEIVVTAAIISILVLILAPVVTSRSRQAKLTSATQDLEHLAEAENRSAIDTGYFYPLHVLDDLPLGNNISNTNPDPTIDNYDGIRDELLNNVFGARIFIRTDLDQVQLGTTPFVSNYLDIYQFKILVNETAFGWRGPYINWYRDANGNDWPDDPWGNDYLLFVRGGGLGPYDSDFKAATQSNPIIIRPQEQFNRNVQLFLPAAFTNGAESAFDRPTILSLGPDSLPGDLGQTQFGTGDDIYRKF